MIASLFSDVRFALRWLRRSPAFTLIAIASLAVGIGFNTALFTIVDALVFRPLPVERVDRLVDVFTSGGDHDQYATSSYPDSSTSRRGTRYSATCSPTARTSARSS